MNKKFLDLKRQTRVIPIPENRKHCMNPDNYCPIALTSCLYKTKEFMISNRFIWFLESDGLITNLQSGFHKKSFYIKKFFFTLEKAWKYGIMRTLHNFALKVRLPDF